MQKRCTKYKSDTLIARLQQEFEKEIAKNCAATIEKFQSEYKTDVFQFCQILQAEEPAYWEIIYGDWEDNVFPGMNVEIEVDVTINLTGSTR